MIWEKIITNSLQNIIHTMDMSDPVEISFPFSVMSPWNITLHMITFSTAVLRL